MAVFNDFREALAYLRQPGRPVEVLLCYDSRPLTERTYFSPLADLRCAWSRAGTGRVTVNVFGVAPRDVPGCERTFHCCWCKVALARTFAALNRVEYLIWVDSDAAPVPDLSRQRPAKNRYENKTLQFPSLKSVFRSRAGGPDTVLVGYRECFQEGRSCPQHGCQCKSLIPRAEVRGRQTTHQGHHSFNAGVWIVKCAQPACHEFLTTWLRHRPQRATLKGRWGASQYEQGTFDAHLAASDQATLVAERNFASQSLRLEWDAPESPYMHWYGQTPAPWTGKQLIPRWCAQLFMALSRRQRNSIPSFTRYCRTVLRTHNSILAKERQAGRAKTVAAVRKKMAKPIRVRGQSFPSMRAARTALGVTHRQLMALRKQNSRP